MTSLLDNPIGLFILTLTGLWLIALAGFYCQKIWRPLRREEQDEFKSVLGACLTLLGLIVGFSFAMSVNRYDMRKGLEESEANAIGTEFVRADLLPAPAASALKDALKAYLERRVTFYDVEDPALVARAEQEGARLQSDIWTIVRNAASAQPTPITALAVAGANDVINAQGYVLAAWRNRIPVGGLGIDGDHRRRLQRAARLRRPAFQRLSPARRARDDFGRLPADRRNRQPARRIYPRASDQSRHRRGRVQSPLRAMRQSPSFHARRHGDILRICGAFRGREPTPTCLRSLSAETVPTTSRRHHRLEAAGACSMKARKIAMFVGAVAAIALSASEASAAQCGTSAAGFDAWKQSFAQEAKAHGIGPTGIAALMSTSYAQPTINADRGMKSFHLSLDAFLAKRGGSVIVARGRKLKESNAALFAQIEQRYGVPAGPLIAIWGMETGFGGVMGNQNMLSSVATLAYDCRRPDFFTDQLYAALKLVDRGTFSAGTRGSMHGEVGQTQFMPKTVLEYGVGNLDLSAGALMSTANYLKAHGWSAGAGYQPGEPNFAAIQAWNAATVYQEAIALIGKKIDGGDR